MLKNYLEINRKTTIKENSGRTRYTIAYKYGQYGKNQLDPKNGWR